MIIKVVDGRDIGVVQSGEGNSLFLQKLTRTFIDDCSLMDDLDGYFTVEVLVAGSINHTHPAAADLLNDAIVGEGLTDESVGFRHSAAILTPSTPAGWLYDPETPLESSMTIELCSYNARHDIARQLRPFLPWRVPARILA